MFSDFFESTTGFRWKLRLDLDLAQRCLAIICISYSLNFILSFLPIPSFLFPSISFFEFWTTVALVAAIAKSSMQLRPDGKCVLITGCDTGFGFALAKHLHSLGFTVFAGCLNSTASELSSIKNLHVLQLDVTKEEDWTQAMTVINQHTDSLWGLVNNAGWATYGDVEWVSMRTYKKILGINLSGVIRGCKRCLPLVRKAKGRVVTVVSGLGRMAVPNRSPYVMTKYALEGFLDCLRYEMDDFGVKVSMIEPGNFIAGTNIFNEQFVNQQAELMWGDMSEEVRESYGRDYFDRRVDIMRGYMTGGVTDISPVINAYTDALLDAFPQKRYQPMDLYFKVRCAIATHLPEIVYDSIYVSNIHREKKEKEI